VSGASSGPSADSISVAETLDLEPTINGDRATVEIAHMKARGEELLQITTRPVS
jgi:hypothetical protein